MQFVLTRLSFFPRDVSWSVKVLAEMNVVNERLTWAYKLPYQMGMGVTLFLGLAAIPNVFELNTAIWFCENFVKDDIPDLKELDTTFKVGTWTWQWMEPMIGTASFVLLSFQLIRSHMEKIDMKPFGR